MFQSEYMSNSPTGNLGALCNLMMLSSSCAAFLRNNKTHSDCSIFFISVSGWANIHLGDCKMIGLWEFADTHIWKKSYLSNVIPVMAYISLQHTHTHTHKQNHFLYLHVYTQEHKNIQYIVPPSRSEVSFTCFCRILRTEPFVGRSKW